MISLYESLLDNEDEIIEDDSFLIKKWFEENVETLYNPTRPQNSSYKIKIDGKDVTVIGTIRINGAKCNFRSKVLKLFRFKKLIGDLEIYNLTQKKNYWLPEEITGDVWIMNGSCTELPKLPKNASGIYLNNLYKLKTLNGCPDKCKSLEISLCQKLTSLEGAPEVISKIFTVDYCDSMTTLYGFPKKVNRFHFRNHHPQILGKIKTEFFELYRNNVDNWSFCEV